MVGHSSSNNQLDRTDNSDKRYLPRWEVSNRIQYQLEDEHRVKEARTKDLSCAGACLVVSETVPLNKRLRVKIYLSPNKSVETEGKIVWCKSEGLGNIIGIDFCETPEEVKETILNYAFEVKRQDLINHWFRGWK